MPAVLLLGEYGSWNIEQNEYDYELYSISDLIKAAK